MPTYKFTADRIIDADDERDAWEKFADGSWDFAESAEVEEVDEHTFQTKESFQDS